MTSKGTAPSIIVKGKRINSDLATKEKIGKNPEEKDANIKKSHPILTMNFSTQVKN